MPVAFATAWYGLADLAGARAGQRVLVHAATGGVGMAAVAIARHLGLEVYATASPGKHPVLAAMGLDGDHIASSRDAGFGAAFLAATGGAGMDIVLSSLAGDLTDASLRLLPRGGAFLDMGKADIRDPAAVAAAHPGVAYRAFDLGEAGPARLGEILALVTGLLAAGDLAAAPGGGLGRPPGAGGDAVHARGPARRQDRAGDAPPDPAAPRPGHGAGDRGDRAAGRAGGPAPGRHGAGRPAGAGVPVRPGRAGRGRAGRAGSPGPGRRCGWRPATRPTAARWPRCWHRYHQGARWPGWCTRPG